MIAATTTRALLYAFVPTPNPIRASVAGGNPNTVSIQVIIASKPGPPATLDKITIEIPVGEETSDDLSATPNLPAPSYDTSLPWTIDAAGSTISIVPAEGSTGTVTTPIVFTLDGIQVNETPGPVPLTVTEFPPPPAPKVIDDSTYSLLKEQSDFPVTSFSADPAILTDLDQAVTLSWTCSDEGKQSLFGLRADTESAMLAEGAGGPARQVTDAGLKLDGLRNCVDDGVCYTWQDGLAGVVVPRVDQTTTFHLDVVQTDSSGHRTVIATLSTTVRVDVPTISPESHLVQRFTLPFVWLHWLAFNAGRCSVSVNGAIVDDAAPTDTYEDGYLLALKGGPGTYQISVIAHAVFGSAEAPFIFPNVVAGPKASIPTGQRPVAVAVTPDGSLGVVADLGDSTLTVVNLTTRQPAPRPMSVGKNPWSIAITPDSKLALATYDIDAFTGGIAVVNLATLQAEAPISLLVPRDPIAERPTVVRVTPDGQRALVGNYFGNQIVVVDLVKRQVEGTPWTMPAFGLIPDLAITPDGKYALVLVGPGPGLAVVDLATGQPEPKVIPIKFQPQAIAVTPDSKLALVVSSQSNVVTVVDIASRTAEQTTIPVVSGAISIAITPDGARAIVVSNSVAELTLIDIASRSATTGTVPGQTTGAVGPAVAVTADGSNLLLVNSPANQLEIF